MKNIKFCRTCLLIIVICSLNFSAVFASSHVSQNIYFKSVNKKVSTVLLDINNLTIKPKVARAHKGITLAQDLKSMANLNKNPDSKVIAGINGSYFSSYNKNPLPYGTIIEDGKVLHIGNYGCVIGFTEENQVIIDQLNITIDGYINGEFRYYAWGLNHPRTETDAIVIFTPEYKDKISASNGKAVVVKEGLVQSILTGNNDIYVGENQIVILFNENVSHLADRFRIGDSVSYKTNFESKNIDQNNPDSVKWEDVKYAVGAGPSLLINGKITADGLSEGFYEAKINTAKAQRSFVGVTYDNKIIIGTAPSITIKDLATICTEMNLKSAMCLDGGASSSLLYEGKYITHPGRNVNNGLIFLEQQVIDQCSK
ncbi:phosphodiester glycosidase family protein [Crassaminicella profunda]|uniref:phosphodiester glycosidase family protein n=1 Tax=Crassaminicella profunda TaxID=1286698 RepID=UPI001CA69FD4|nr:phosphodiester glycosidase family protein [Crassaminicella profunda]QZY55934.1 phosphodiester glycosidase family protein [Crassaminicella profunda]